MTLNQLKIGEKGIVKKINTTNKELRRRMLDMGITTRVVIEMKRISPLGDPIDIKLRGYELCMRRKELENIEIEVFK